MSPSESPADPLADDPTSPLAELEPRPVWRHFDAIRRVPRPSKHEEEISAMVRRWAAEHGFAVRADAAGNLVVAVPASRGHEAAPVVVLQAHLDMVCEKNSGVEHDFHRQGIEVEVRGDWLYAVGTTLGADNGLGVASAMAVAVDPEVRHGPLELLFTLDEETGLNGALAFDGSLLSGKLLVNLDTEEDDAIYMGCAGAGGSTGTLSLERQAGAGEPWELVVRGLRGGHSGMDIIENRGNALKVAARVLVAAVEEGADLGLARWVGGSKANAIPRESFARILVDARAKERTEAAIATVAEELQSELGTMEPDLEIELRPVEPGAAEAGNGSVLTADCRDRLLRLVDAAPNGVLAMSREVPGLVETSNNVAVLTMDEEHAVLSCSSRSSVTAALAGVRRSLSSLFQLAGAEAEGHGGYPGWKPNPDSELVRRTVTVYRELFGAAPEVKAVHAGLECGILVEKVAGLDAVSIGPEIRNPHSPDEKAKISSVAKFYRLLGELLGALAAS